MFRSPPPRQADAPCYRCLYSDISNQEAPNCSENGVLAPLVGVIGSMQALEAIKLIAGYGEPSTGKLLIADVKYGDWRQLTLKKDPLCPVCAQAC